MEIVSKQYQEKRDIKSLKKLTSQLKTGMYRVEIIHMFGEPQTYFEESNERLYYYLSDERIYKGFMILLIEFDGDVVVDFSTDFADE